MTKYGPSFTVDGVSYFLQSQRAKWNADLTKQLVKFISGTKTSLDCAIYDLRDTNVLQALKDAKSHGKKLRIAYDAGKGTTSSTTVDPKPSGNTASLTKFGLQGVATPVHETSGNLMHDKFLVRDGTYVWTGSANFTQGGLQLQDNNCLSFSSPQIAKVYTATFQDLLSPSHKHPKSGATPKNPKPNTGAKLGKTTLTPYFSPSSGEGIETVVSKALQKAKSVRVIAFLISDPGILQALAGFKKPGSDIKGIYDPNGMGSTKKAQQQSPQSFWFLKDKRFVRAPSHAFKPGGEQNFMHNKVMILDKTQVITGSYNFSEHAEANDENLLVIDSPSVAAGYNAYFDALYSQYGGKP